MSPKDDGRIKIITWIVSVLMPIIFVILIAYFPIINTNSKAATEALIEIKNLKESQKQRFENIEEKISQQNRYNDINIQEIKEDVSINKQNFRIITDKLRDQGLLKNVVIIDRSLLSKNEINGGNE